MPRKKDDLAVFRETFGDEAESIHRGVVVASERIYPMSEALALVLVVRDKRLTSVPLKGFEAHIARAMDEVKPAPPLGKRWGHALRSRLGRLRRPRRDPVPWNEAGIAGLRVDFPTSLGTFPRGTRVQLTKQMPDGQFVIHVIGVRDAVFPVPASDLEPVEEPDDALEEFFRRSAELRKKLSEQGD